MNYFLGEVTQQGTLTTSATSTPQPPGATLLASARLGALANAQVADFPPVHICNFDICHETCKYKTKI